MGRISTWGQTPEQTDCCSVSEDSTQLIAPNPDSPEHKSAKAASPKENKCWSQQCLHHSFSSTTPSAAHRLQPPLAFYPLQNFTEPKIQHNWSSLLHTSTPQYFFAMLFHWTNYCPPACSHGLQNQKYFSATTVYEHQH